MHLDSDDLLARIRQDWPTEYELTRLRLLADVQAAEIDRLTAAQPGTFTGTAARPYVLGDDEARHGG